ncbi:molybdopterin-dependent oxidoreductase [Streptomyces marincola]|uniref:molybdopterin-dependent oxidoreductase n=1 Tax=Streptomyces marincola TaxID=2878388 RepID=UPI001CF503DA|nr:molybdopterin-dependent oxidoreductase [Streptomyces marincola]UCM90495.1 molybdopterin-dependent oxidoreductase [Streptomyces marincola]
MSDEEKVHNGRRAAVLAAAFSGLLAAGAGLAVAELVASGVRREAGPLTAVGGAVVDRTPAAVKDWAIATFGTHDKLALRLGTLGLIAASALVLGVLAPRFPRSAAAGVLAFGAVGAVAAAGRPGAERFDALPSAAGAVAGALVLTLLAGQVGAGRAGRRLGADGGEFDRRRFVAAVGSVAAASAGAGLIASRVNEAGRARAAAARGTVRLPAPASPAGPVPRDAELSVPGLGPFLTPNADFYRIDTALTVPRVDAGAWRLRIHGAGVERQVTHTFDDLLRRDLVERRITLTCVSNQVGGPYTGNARWIGVPLADLLREAGVRPPSRGGPADQLVSRSVDGMTIGTPLETVMDGRDALLALGMNGEPLPFVHGFPVRMVVPGLYGYVSACKWLTELELTTFADYDAYWVKRGWAEKAPIRTQSRIDTPRGLAGLPAGPVRVAGVAWAQHTGIDRVELRVDEGPWREAELAEEDSPDTWRQWRWEWDASPGRHRIEVRATDRSGETQTADRSDPIPGGATGRHSVVVNVT